MRVCVCGMIIIVLKVMKKERMDEGMNEKNKERDDIKVFDV